MDKKPLKKDRIIGIVCLAISIFYAINSMSIKAPLNPGDPGGKLFPLIGSAIMLLCGIVLIVRKDESTSKTFLTKQQWIRALALFVGYIMVLVLMWFVGFTITAFITLLALCILFTITKEGTKINKKIIIKSVVYAAVFTAALYLIYIVALKMQLPTGKLFKLF